MFINQKEFTLKSTGLNLFTYKYLIPQLLKRGLNSYLRKSLCLDFGCGKGELCQILKIERQREVVGIDLSLINIKCAKVRVDDINVHYVLCDGCKLPFRDNVFDNVFTIGVLHHIPNLSHAVSEISRVCRNKGCIIGIEPNLFHPHVTVLISNPRILQLFSIIQIGEKPINPKNLIVLLEAEGFQFLYKDFRLGLKFIVTPFELILKPEFLLKIYEILSLLDFLVLPVLRNSFLFYARKVKSIPKSNTHFL